uniref:Uncharacterized protein n=1 Tax=Knipowitschia caucasica TaxID=637954 RepID=A0AAV2JL51_KNICA
MKTAHRRAVTASFRHWRSRSQCDHVRQGTHLKVAESWPARLKLHWTTPLKQSNNCSSSSCSSSTALIHLLRILLAPKPPAPHPDGWNLWGSLQEDAGQYPNVTTGNMKSSGPGGGEAAPDMQGLPESQGGHQRSSPQLDIRRPSCQPASCFPPSMNLFLQAPVHLTARSWNDIGWDGETTSLKGSPKLNHQSRLGGEAQESNEGTTEVQLSVIGICGQDGDRGVVVRSGQGQEPVGSGVGQNNDLITREGGMVVKMALHPALAMLFILALYPAPPGGLDGRMEPSVQRLQTCHTQGLDPINSSGLSVFASRHLPAQKPQQPKSPVQSHVPKEFRRRNRHMYGVRRSQYSGTAFTIMPRPGPFPLIVQGSCSWCRPRVGRSNRWGHCGLHEIPRPGAHVNRSSMYADVGQGSVSQ